MHHCTPGIALRGALLLDLQKAKTLLDLEDGAGASTRAFFAQYRIAGQLCDCAVVLAVATQRASTFKSENSHVKLGAQIYGGGLTGSVGRRLVLQRPTYLFVEANPGAAWTGTRCTRSPWQLHHARRIV